MGCATSAPTETSPSGSAAKLSDMSLSQLAPDRVKLMQEKKEDETATRDKTKKFFSAHTKQFERYFNRQFKVSVCSAQGERRSMEDDHLCQFMLSNHPNYSLFGVFDGHNGSAASAYLAQHLYNQLNDLSDLQNNESITSVIQEMDKRYLAESECNTSGSTIVFVIICAEVDAFVNMNTMRSSTRKENAPPDPTDLFARLSQTKSKKKQFGYGASGKLDGFAMSYTARVFWCGDSRGYIVRGSDMDDIEYEALTRDHGPTNEMEIARVEQMGGKIVNGRVDGKLAVTRSFGDSRMKYDGSVIIPECEYEEFDVDIGDSLLLCCDGLVEKWSDDTLVERLLQYLNAEKNATDTDTVKVIGALVDDAINEGSTDNISAMLIEFKDGTKQKSHAKYQNVKSSSTKV